MAFSYFWASFTLLDSGDPLRRVLFQLISVFFKPRLSDIGSRLKEYVQIIWLLLVEEHFFGWVWKEYIKWKDEVMCFFLLVKNNYVDIWYQILL